MPAARQLAAWLNAFNAGDRDALVAYHQQYFPYEVASHDVAGIEREFALSQHTGGFELMSLVIEGGWMANPGAPVGAILKERRSDRFSRVMMEVDAAKPHRVLRFVITPISTPAQFLSPEQRKLREVEDAKVRALFDGTLAARQLAAWLTAFNAGDRDALIAYHRKHFPYDVASDDVQGINRELDLSQRTGGYDVKSSENPTSTFIVVVLKERASEHLVQVSMEVEAAEPHPVVRFALVPIPTTEE